MIMAIFVEKCLSKDLIDIESVSRLSRSLDHLIMNSADFGVAAKRMVHVNKLAWIFFCQINYQPLIIIGRAKIYRNQSKMEVL